DTNRLELVNARIQTINALLFKHQLKTEIEMINYTDALQERINSIESVTARIEALEARQIQLQTELEGLAQQISLGRQAQVANLENELVALLKQVGIPDARVNIVLQPSGVLHE